MESSHKFGSPSAGPSPSADASPPRLIATRNPDSGSPGTGAAPRGEPAAFAPTGLRLLGLGWSQYSQELQLQQTLANGELLPYQNPQRLENNCCMCASLMFMLYVHYLERLPLEDDERLRRLGREVLTLGTDLYYEYSFAQGIELCLPDVLRNLNRLKRDRPAGVATPGAAAREAANQAETNHLRALMHDTLQITSQLVLGRSERAKHLNLEAVQRRFRPMVDFERLTQMRMFQKIDVVEQTTTNGIVQLNPELAVVAHAGLAAGFRRCNLLRALVCQCAEDRLTKAVNMLERYYEQIRQQMSVDQAWATPENVAHALAAAPVTDHELLLMTDESYLSDGALLRLIDRAYHVALSTVTSRISRLLGGTFEPNKMRNKEIEICLGKLLALAAGAPPETRREAALLLLLLRAHGHAAMIIHRVAYRSRLMASHNVYALRVFGREVMPPWQAVSLMNYSVLEDCAAEARRLFLPRLFRDETHPDGPLCAPFALDGLLQLMQLERGQRSTDIGVLLTVGERSFAVVLRRPQTYSSQTPWTLFDSHPVGPNQDAILVLADTPSELVGFLETHHALAMQTNVEVMMFYVADVLDKIVGGVVEAIERRVGRSIREL